MKIGIFGAGAIGCYVGGKLSTVVTEPVQFLCRPRLLKEFQEKGNLSVSELDGSSAKCSNVHAFEDPKSLADCDVVFVCVKSLDTEAAAVSLQSLGLKTESIIVSLQNGVKNTGLIREKLPNHTILKGMISFNVERIDKDDEAPNYGKCTAGPVIVEEPEPSSSDAVKTLQKSLVKSLNDSGIPTQSSSKTDMEGIQWCKLLFNLNNAVNALSGVPLKTELLDPDFRQILRESQAEAIAVLKSANKPVKSFGTMIPWLAQMVLPMPNFLYKIFAKGALNISPDAHSSMFNDIKFGRKTEIDFINGEILELGKEIGVATPVNTAICRLIKEVEAKGEATIIKMTPAEIQAEIAKEKSK